MKQDICLYKFLLQFSFMYDTIVLDVGMLYELSMNNPTTSRAE